ncbi:hypothetical protein BH24ACT10_BH24ACT10_04260 [soil metagenome]
MAGSPVASEAPTGTVEESSLDAESPALPTPVAGPGADDPGADAPAPAAPAPAPAVAPPAQTVLPAGFGRPEQPARMEYSGPAYDAAPGSTGVTTSSGPGGTGVTTGQAQNRNDLCSCGSGRKYKRFHVDPRAS